MPISVQCANCKSKYNLADALAGKKVKCRSCGAAIAVPMPGVIGIEDDDLPPIPSLPTALEQDNSPPTGRACPSCGAISAGNTPMCLVCGHSYTKAAPRPAAAAPSGPSLPIGLADEGTPKKRSRFLRAPGNPTMNNIDGLIKMLGFWLLVAGFVVWEIHVAHARGGFSITNLIPPFLAFGILLLMAFVMGLAIKITCEKISYPPRHDYFSRIATALVLPFSVAMLCSGYVADNPNLGMLMGLSWVLAGALLIYFLRSEPVEWIASLAAGGAGLFIVWLVIGLVSPYFSMLTGPLYRDVMPGDGPWYKLATDTAPPLNPATKPAEAPAEAATPAPATPVPPVAVAPTPAPAPVTPAIPAPNKEGVVIVQGPVHSSPDIIKSTPEVHGPIVQATPGVEVASDPGLQNIRDLSVNMILSPYMLVVKSGDNQSIVQRWSISPLAMKGETQNDEFPNKPNEYLLNPAGSVLVTLLQFPKNQILLSSFDINKAPRKIPLDTHKEWTGTPTLVGFIDQNHFLMRWKGLNETLQIWSCLDGSLYSSKSSTFVNDDPNYWAIYPSPLKGGARMAIVARGQQDSYPQIAVFHTEGWQVFKQITPMQMDFTCTGLALSPDGSAVAMSAETTEGGTIMAFNLQTGDNLFTSIVPASTFPAHVAHRFHNNINSSFLHGLVWMANNQAIVVSGNLVYDATTGKKIGALGVEDAVDCYNVGTNTLAIVQDTAGTKNVVITKVDLGAMRAGGER